MAPGRAPWVWEDVVTPVGRSDAQATFEFIAEHTRDVIVRVDVQGRVTYVSPSIRTYGYEPEALIGATGVDLFHPDDREHFAANGASLLRGETQVAVNREHRLRTAAGDWVWVEGAPKVVWGDDGQPIGFVNVFRDVSERHAAEAALRESEARYRLIAESMNDIILQADADAVLTFVSPSVRAFGYEPEDLVGRRIDDLLHPEDLERVRANRVRNAAGEPLAPARERSNRYRTASGEWKWLEGTPRVLRDAAGRMTGTINVMRDVTERRAQAELFETAFRHAPVGIALVSLRGKFLRVNDAFCAMVGYPEAELLQTDTPSISHPDDRFAGHDERRGLLKGEATTYQHDKRYLKPDGTVVWARLTGALVHHPDGSPAHFITQFEDLTERLVAEAALKDSEARFRLIAENTSDLIVMHDLKGRITYLSPAIRQAGYEPDELLGQVSMAYMPPEDAEAVAGVFGRLLAGDESENVRVRWRAPHGKTGELMWLESSPSLVRDPSSGKPTGFLDTVRDIGVQVRTEEALAEAQAVAEAATAVKSQFLANMSHEIRTPLTAVLGFASLLREQPNLDGPAQDYVKRISGAGAALLTIVNDVLDFSKLEAGMFEIRPRPTDLAELARETLSLFAAQAADKGLTLSVEAHPDLPAVVMVDGDRLRQILINLSGNAVKFTGQGGVTLRVAPAGDAAWRFEVRDTGAGLDADQCARLFQRFSQVEGSVGHGGTGLGLAICRALTEAMGGEIGVTSTPGEGSIFHLTLPGPAVEAASGPAATDEDALPIVGVRVLVIDDNAMNRELARGMLEALGAEVTESGSGHEALEQLALIPVDVVLLDLRMPIMGGVEVLRRLRAQDGPNRYVPALAFTADAETGNRADLAGFEGVVRKPISVSELAVVVAAATDWRTTASAAAANQE